MALSGTTLSRGGWTLTTLAGLSLWFTGPHAKAALVAATGDDFPRALLGLASLVQLMTAAWVILIVGLAQLIGPTAVLRAVAPRVLRGALFAGAAGAIAIAPAEADRGVIPPQDRSVARVATHNLDGLPFPDRPHSDPDRPAASQQRINRIVIVQPGDTLWAIARRSLPEGASDAKIARACGLWFAANRAVIGHNPNLIIPAQRLHAPTKDHV
jgi:nucleoid-associated protein YgaU